MLQQLINLFNLFDMFFPYMANIWRSCNNDVFFWLSSIFSPYMINIQKLSKYILNTYFSNYDVVKKF